MVGKLTKDSMASCSILPIIFNKSPYQTPNEALDRCIRARKGEDVRKGDEQSTIQKMGDKLEPLILQLTAEELGLSNLVTDITTPVQHEALPLMGSLDGIAYADNLIIKPDNETIFTEDGEPICLSGKGVLAPKATAVYPPEDGIPADYRGVLQCKGLMAATNYDWAVVAVLYRSTMLQLYVMRRDFAFERELDTVITDFDRRIATEEYYPPTTSSDAARIHAEADPELAYEFSDEDEQLFRTIVHVDEQMKLLQDLKAKATLEIQNKMGKATVGTHDRWQIKWGSKSYKAQPEKIVPAKDAYTVRNKTVQVKRLEDDEERN
jgi:predicted phage-related endonuclease